MAAALAAGALWCGWGAPAAEARTATVAILPSGTSLEDLARISNTTIGLMSMGIGDPPAEQTYLDISQGSRVSDIVYGEALPPPPAFNSEVPQWDAIVARAGGAPADLVPGLLASSLLRRGIPVGADPALVAPSLIAADRGGYVDRDAPNECTDNRCPGLSIVAAPVSAMPHLALRTHAGSDLLIAFAAPSAADPGISAFAVMGGSADLGHGAERTTNITSDSTRTDGLVLSTDLAPTILRWFGVPIPGAMDGEPIRFGGLVSTSSIVDRQERMEAIPDRRAPVVVISLLAWIATASAVALLAPGLRREALRWLALAFAYMPLMLLAGAALQPGGLAEGLLVGLGAAGLAAVTSLLVRGWAAVAIACAITVIAYGIDVATGSELTKLSLLGPNPVFGARFYGIGNELEALIAVMVPVGVGAGLSAYTGWERGLSRRGVVAAFVVAAAAGAVIFAAGRFGADVGAAVVLPIGAAIAVASLPRTGFEAFARHSPHNSSKLWGRRSTVAIVIAAPIAALVGLAFIDLISGGNAHLSRSVLDTGGAGDLADVAQRRLELSAHDFAQAAGNPLFWAVIAGIGVAIWQWRRIDAWLARAPLARAGFLGGCAAVAVGMLVNDSGATFLVLGSLALGAALAFAWAQAGTDP